MGRDRVGLAVQQSRAVAPLPLDRQADGGLDLPDGALAGSEHVAGIGELPGLRIEQVLGVAAGGGGTERHVAIVAGHVVHGEMLHDGGERMIVQPQAGGGIEPDGVVARWGLRSQVTARL
ncbi:MAG: hypothetical protein AMS20_07620 [Gemmatimonas sp. SG8_28]|nr:MAG: hypothetical protein AMS20_07620 [Gemmatimonas sp. SG8_28]